MGWGYVVVKFCLGSTVRSLVCCSLGFCFTCGSCSVCILVVGVCWLVLGILFWLLCGCGAGGTV